MTDTPAKKEPSDDDDDPRWPNTMRHHRWEKREPKGDEPAREPDPGKDPPAGSQADGWGDGR